MITVLFAVGVVFELPIFVLALARLGIVPASKLRRNRRIGYVIVAAVAVALPGVDPVTTLFEMGPLMLLFEASIWLAVLMERRWKAREAARSRLPGGRLLDGRSRRANAPRQAAPTSSRYATAQSRTPMPPPSEPPNGPQLQCEAREPARLRR